MTKPPFPPFPSFPPLPKSIQDLPNKVSEMLKASPAAEVERHLKGAFSTALGKMDIVTRDDFEIQQQMLARALEKLAVLEKRLSELEALETLESPAKKPAKAAKTDKSAE